MDTEARVTKGSRDTGGVVHVGVCGLTWCLTYKKKAAAALRKTREVDSVRREEKNRQPERRLAGEK